MAMLGNNEWVDTNTRHSGVHRRLRYGSSQRGSDIVVHGLRYDLSFLKLLFGYQRS